MNPIFKRRNVFILGYFSAPSILTFRKKIGLQSDLCETNRCNGNLLILPIGNQKQILNINCTVGLFSFIQITQLLKTLHNQNVLYLLLFNSLST